jgi:hypothetical protein
MIAKRIAAGLLPLLCVALASVAGAQGYAEIRDRELASLVADLEGFVEWCGKKKLYGVRAEAYRLILRIDPDNEEAHEGLDHEKGPNGEWRAPEKWREPRNFDKGALKQADEERAKAVQPFCDRLRALVEGGELGEEDTRLAAGDVLLVDPDNPFMRELLGEVRDGEAWVLRETVAAREGRNRIRGIVREAYQRTPAPEASEPNERERGIGLGWSAAAATEVVRVVGTVGADELRKTARSVTVAKRAFEEIFEVEAGFEEGFTVFLLSDAQEGRRFLDGYPELTDPERDRLAGLDGSGIQATGDFAHWADDERRRRDAAVRYALAWLGEVTFFVGAREGWIYEGFGLYLTREMVGTRLTWFTLPSTETSASPAEEEALRARLLNDETNWMNEALEVLSKPRRPALASVMQRGLNEMTSAEMLFSYVTAAYLLEGRTLAETSELLRLIGAGVPEDQAVPRALGISLDELDRRVRRWLSERR